MLILVKKSQKEELTYSTQNAAFVFRELRDKLSLYMEKNFYVESTG